MDTGRFAYFSPAGDLNHMRTGPEVPFAGLGFTSFQNYKPVCPLLLAQIGR
jgi:hypothetical protein